MSKNNHTVLINDLENADIPDWIIARAKNFDYHDSKTSLALPKIALAKDLCDAVKVRKNIIDTLFDNIRTGKYDNPIDLRDVAKNLGVDTIEDIFKLLVKES